MSSLSLKSDLVVVNAEVVSLDEDGSVAEAVAIRDGVIVYVGDNAGIERFTSYGTEILDARGHALVPGLIDSHIHLIWFGFALHRLDFREVDSIENLKKAVASKAGELKAGEWILGAGWDQERFKEERYPNRWDLDEAAPRHPVLLHRVCSHIGVANSSALDLLGISEETPDPPGGTIDRNKDTGQPTGILRETAMEEAVEKVPPPSPEDYSKATTGALRFAASHGLTTLHFVSVTPEELRVCQELHRRGQLSVRLRLYLWVDWADSMVELGVQRGLGDDWLRIQGVKLYVDGSLGARTALMREPYSDEPDNLGMARLEKEELERIVKKTDRAGLQLAIHGIGDRGVEWALDALEKVTGKGGNPLRHRVEHASVLAPDLIERMAQNGILATVQPRFIISDFWTVDRVGEERARWVYPFKTMLASGVRTSFSSDCPVDPLDPIYQMYSAIGRGGKEGIEAYKLTKKEAVSAKEALRLYTVAGAYAAHDEHHLGSIEVGKLADMVLLSGNPLETSLDDFLDTEVLATIVGGKIVYRRRN